MAQVVTGLGGGGEEQKKSQFERIPDPNELLLYKLSPADAGLTKENFTAEATNLVKNIINNSGGGVAGLDTQIQFNNHGSFGADANLTFSYELEPLDITAATLSIGGNGGKLLFDGANDAVISIVNSPSPGTLYIQGFDPITESNVTGGSVYVSGGTGDGESPGGEVTLQGGDDATGTFDGGKIILRGANGTTPVGGHIDILAGNAASGTQGQIRLKTGSSSTYAILNCDSITGSDKTFTFPNTTGTLALTSNIIPSGADTEIVFNDGGVFGAEPTFTFDKTTKVMTIGAENNVSEIRAPNATTSNTGGGSLNLYSGDATGGQAGGDMAAYAGNGGPTGDGGSAYLNAGVGGATSGSGGNLVLSAGSSTTSGDGGTVFITAGSEVGGGTNGRIYLASGNSNSARIDTFALSADTEYSFQDAPGQLVTQVGHGRATAQTAANTNVHTLTVGGADTTYQVMANVLVTTSTVHSFSVTVDYTDEGNTARTLTLPFSQLAGTLVTAITNATGAGPYGSVPITIRAKSATNIVFKTAGTFTTVTYNVDASIIQIA